MQRGTLRKEYGGWYLRFWEPTTDGRRKRCVRLAPIDEDHPDEASVALLAAQVLDPFNRKQITPESSMTVAKFIEEVYLPHVRRELRPSTAKDYDDVFRVHLRDRLGDIRLRDFRTLHGQRILRDVEGVGHTSRLRIKSFLSGVFKHARREGILDTANPMVDTSVPGRTVRRRMPAYDMEQIEAMLGFLPEPSRTIVAVAALTGLRLSELRGLQWRDYDGESIAVTRTVWRTHVGAPKTADSEARVPVLPVLKNVLDRYRNGAADDAFIFTGERGKPMNLANLARRVIIPSLKANEIPWLGWHGFRRGLATNLYTLGVPAKVIQGILRHSDVKTTMGIYVQRVDSEAVEALRKLEDVLAPFGVIVEGTRSGNERKSSTSTKPA